MTSAAPIDLWSMTRQEVCQSIKISDAANVVSSSSHPEYVKHHVLRAFHAKAKAAIKKHHSSRFLDKLELELEHQPSETSPGALQSSQPRELFPDLMNTRPIVRKPFRATQARTRLAEKVQSCARVLRKTVTGRVTKSVSVKRDPQMYIAYKELGAKVSQWMFKHPTFPRCGMILERARELEEAGTVPPEDVLKALDKVILYRQLVGETYSVSGYNCEQQADSDRKHNYFIDVMKVVRKSIGGGLAFSEGQSRSCVVNKDDFVLL